MSETVKLIIEIPKYEYEEAKRYVAEGVFDYNGINATIFKAVSNSIPLANDSEKDEVQAYFDGQAYGWEQGRKALIDDIKAEIKRMDYHMIDCDVLVSQEEILNILDNIGKGDGE